MGGSGGGGYFSDPPKDVLGELEAVRRQTQNEAYEAECAAMLGDLLAQFNNRDHEAIRRHLGEIAAALGKDIDGTIDLGMAGSVAKHTYVDGLSDIDCLVKLDSCELANQTPEQAKAYLEERLQERFPRTEITTGHLAVTVQFSDIEIQLLPAVSCEGAVNIPDESGKGWSRIRPTEFAQALTHVNQEFAGRVVPTIKLAKAIIANLPEQQRISGYHVESLAVNLFRDYSGPRRSKEMLEHFFTAGAGVVLRPIRDRTGQSVHVDDYLGEPESVRRRVVSDTFGRIGRKMGNADAAGNLDAWRELFGE